MYAAALRKELDGRGERSPAVQVWSPRLSAVMSVPGNSESVTPLALRSCVPSVRQAGVRFTPTA